jgi:hypothetical protein
MEAASEKTPDKKRGRPRKFDYARLDAIAQEFGPKTRRGQQTHEYAIQAYSVLNLARDQGQEELTPLLENVRPTVFAELGRCLELDDLTVFWSCVGYLLSDQPPAKKAIATIRRARLGESKPYESPARLHSVLVKAINDHLARYPETDRMDLLTALDMTVDSVKKSPDN